MTAIRSSSNINNLLHEKSIEKKNTAVRSCTPCDSRQASFVSPPSYALLPIPSVCDMAIPGISVCFPPCPHHPSSSSLPYLRSTPACVRALNRRPGRLDSRFIHRNHDLPFRHVSPVRKVPIDHGHRLVG